MPHGARVPMRSHRDHASVPGGSMPVHSTWDATWRRLASRPWSPFNERSRWSAAFHVEHEAATRWSMLVAWLRRASIGPAGLVAPSRPFTLQVERERVVDEGTRMDPSSAWVPGMRLKP